MLVVENITVKYGNIAAVRSVSLRVEAGETVALIGPNGAGKTTTLAAIMGIARAAQGRILFDGRDLTSASTEDIVRQGVILTPEGRRIFGRLTIAENLELAAAFRKDRAAVRRDRDWLLDLFPILARRLRLPAGALSGGEAQQLAIARSLMSAPRLLLLDEPSLGLAPRLIETIFEAIAQLKQRGLTLLMVEQQAPQALAIADRAYVMSSGEIVSEGSAREIREQADLLAFYLGARSKQAQVEP